MPPPLVCCAGPLRPSPPNAQVRDTLNIRFTSAGPRAKLCPMVGVPMAGFKSKQPNPPEHTPSNNAGLAVGKPVFNGSRPVVMLYGWPLFAAIKGLIVIFHLSG